MKFTIDTDAKTLAVEREGGPPVTHDLYSREAFAEISRQWVRAGWSLSYYRGFTWMGLPVLQLPDDLVRFQEVLWDVRPRRASFRAVLCCFMRAFARPSAAGELSEWISTYRKRCGRCWNGTS